MTHQTALQFAQSRARLKRGTADDWDQFIVESAAAEVTQAAEVHQASTTTQEGGAACPME